MDSLKPPTPVIRLPYKYLPLNAGLDAENNIRFLILLPDQRDRIIRCSVQHGSLSSHPPYEALSYTWRDSKGRYSLIPARGDITRSYFILLERHAVSITYNLHEALLQIRHYNQPRTLWIDALCIDQGNKKERGEQVMMMASIFGRASRVLCWLGEEDEYSDRACTAWNQLCWATKVLLWKRGSQMLQLPMCDLPNDFLDILFNRERLHPSFWEESPFQNVRRDEFESLKYSLSLMYIDFTSDIPALANSLFGPDSLAEYIVSDTGQLSCYPHLDEINKALSDLFVDREYWGRLWIVQEFIHAAEITLLCGDREIDFSTKRLLDVALSKASTGTGALWSKADGESLDGLKASIASMNNLASSRDSLKKMSLARALSSYTKRRCSEPRDYIYSLLNIVRDTDIDINYNKPVSEIYIQATRAVIQQEKCLDILVPITTHAFQDPLPLFLPSWVPHFETGIRTCGLTQSLGDGIFEAGGSKSGGHSPYLGPIVDERVLPIHGCFYERVAATGKRMTSWSVEDIKTDLESVLTTARAWKLKLEDTWRTIILGQYRNDVSINEVRTVSSQIADQNFRSDLKSFQTTRTMPVRFLGTLRGSLMRKAFCLTTNKRAAMVLGDVEVGDRFFIARGCSVPLVIRPTASDETYAHAKGILKISTFYKLVGGSYVDGIMDGEVLEMVDGVNLKEETVYLI